MESIDHMVGTVVSHLGSTASANAIAGEPIALGKVTLVVLSTLSIGMGAGGGEGRGTATGKGDGKATAGGPGGGMGEGAGGGVKVRPAAVIAFTPTGVQVLTVPPQPDVFDKVVERMPAVVDMVEKARQSLH